ncbi:hypothetical protein [Cognatiluteimonas lumbrici]|uniref:hypothetical protein n=1 Tax=Cognatiluteimonas lumbrici TaxID=2559601 RepID=UPI001129C1E6|nr:hypothetical protein [Luteimonas lumbrici]
MLRTLLGFCCLALIGCAHQSSIANRDGHDDVVGIDESLAGLLESLAAGNEDFGANPVIGRLEGFVGVRQRLRTSDGFVLKNPQFHYRKKTGKAHQFNFYVEEAPCFSWRRAIELSGATPSRPSSHPAPRQASARHNDQGFSLVSHDPYGRCLAAVIIKDLFIPAVPVSLGAVLSSASSPGEEVVGEHPIAVLVDAAQPDGQFRTEDGYLLTTPRIGWSAGDRLRGIAMAVFTRPCFSFEQAVRLVGATSFDSAGEKRHGSVAVARSRGVEVTIKSRPRSPGCLSGLLVEYPPGQPAAEPASRDAVTLEHVLSSTADPDGVLPDQPPFSSLLTTERSSAWTTQDGYVVEGPVVYRTNGRLWQISLSVRESPCFSWDRAVRLTGTTQAKRVGPHALSYYASAERSDVRTSITSHTPFRKCLKDIMVSY